MILVNEFGGVKAQKEVEAPQPVYTGPPDLGFREFQHDNYEI